DPRVAAARPGVPAEAALAFEYHDLFGHRVMPGVRARPALGEAHESSEAAVGELRQERHLDWPGAGHRRLAPGQRSERELVHSAMTRAPFISRCSMMTTLPFTSRTEPSARRVSPAKAI